MMPTHEQVITGMVETNESLRDENVHLVNELERVRAERDRLRQVLSNVDACHKGGNFICPACACQVREALEAKP